MKTKRTSCVLAVYTESEMFCRAAPAGDIVQMHKTSAASQLNIRAMSEDGRTYKVLGAYLEQPVVNITTQQNTLLYYLVLLMLQFHLL